MLRLIAIRVFSAIPTIVGVATLVFLLVHFIPGDPAMLLAGEGASQEQIEEVRKEYRLDRPLYEQYIDYIRRLAIGDFGVGYFSGRPVATDIIERLPATLELAFASIFLAVVIGIPLGALAGANRGSRLDFIIRFFGANGLAIAPFWLAILLQLCFAMWLDLLPLQGQLPASLSPPNRITGFLLVDSLVAGNLEAFWAACKSLVLPASTLAFGSVASIMRFTRSGIIENLNRDYVAMHRAMGISRRKIVGVYVLRNSLTTVITQIGLLFSGTMVGAVAIEAIFSWPGLGTYLVQALQSSDLPAVMIVVVVLASAYIFVNLLVDIVQMWVDPRIRPTSGKNHL